ncbi:unnamed protein product [Ilex paraguariensis]|uniref:Xylanase inhibitor N-terminal domain-containing protein n=1 Tax=Ilex paraguariensis TaxID=185542 RepID=A0ABC8UHX3_9AQUA
MDAGSSLTWFPCTQRYRCFSCNFGNINAKNISTFIPNQSSSPKLLGCNNPKCEWLFGRNVSSQCEDCNGNSDNCAQTCPAYLLLYGSGGTSGLLLSENLDFPDKIVSDFIVGCSLSSLRTPSGIAGFGRGPESLPAQMDSGDRNSGTVSYTPFYKNPMAFTDYFYVTLIKITVGGKQIRLPYNFLAPGLTATAELWWIRKVMTWWLKHLKSKWPTIVEVLTWKIGLS